MRCKTSYRYCKWVMHATSMQTLMGLSRDCSPIAEEKWVLLVGEQLPRCLSVCRIKPFLYSLLLGFLQDRRALYRAVRSGLSQAILPP